MTEDEYFLTANLTRARSVETVLREFSIPDQAEWRAIRLRYNAAIKSAAALISQLSCQLEDAHTAAKEKS